MPGRLAARLKRAPRRLFGGLRSPEQLQAGAGPTIDWPYYVRHSSQLRSLWERMNAPEREFVAHLMGHDPFRTPCEQWADRPEVLGRTPTLALWHREGFARPHAGQPAATVQ